MATSAEGTQSEEVVGFKCSFCLRKGKVKCSEKFCVECKQQMCSECLQLHNHLLDDHTLLEPARATCQPVLPTDRCEKHGDKVIEMFCEDHDEVGCSTCANVDHRLCETVLNIPSAIQKLFDKGNVKRVFNELERVMMSLAKGKELRRTYKEAVKLEREINLTKVNEYTEKLVAIIQGLGKSTKASLMKEYDEEDRQVQSNETQCKDIKKQVRKYLQQLDNENETHNHLFISMKRGQQLVTQADHIAKDTDEIIKKGPPYIVMDESIEMYLTKNETFNTIKQPTLYTVREKREINVKIKKDSHICSIWDSCLLPDNTLLITDYNNKKLKHVDTTSFNVKDHCDLPDKPYGVCCMGQHEATVCLDNKTIQFVSLDNKLAPTQSIRQSFTCMGIAYHMSKFYIATYTDKIKVLNKEGAVIQTLSTLVSLSRTLKVAINTLDGNVFIADYHNGLLCTDSSGHQLFQHNGQDLKTCSGLCTDDRGSVFVSGFDSHNVVQLTVKGGYLGEVLSAPSGLVKPLSLTWDKERSKLYVTTMGNAILVLDMKDYM